MKTLRAIRELCQALTLFLRWRLIIEPRRALNTQRARIKQLEKAIVEETDIVKSDALDADLKDEVKFFNRLAHFYLCASPPTRNERDLPSS